MVSISKLKGLLSEECLRVNAGGDTPHFDMVYDAEYIFLKKHKSMNISSYQQEYAKILLDSFSITTPYNKLTDDQKYLVIKTFEEGFGLTTEDLKLRNTVIGFKCPHVQLWLYIAKK